MNKIESYFRIILCTSFHFASIHEVDSFLTTLNSHIQRISIIRQRKDKRIICIKIHCTDNGEIDNIRIFPVQSMPCVRRVQARIPTHYPFTDCSSLIPKRPEIQSRWDTGCTDSEERSLQSVVTSNAPCVG